MLFYFPVGLMGDIALPNVNYESEWQSQKLNKSFQQELERMKQEVYHEGLQVEEEGLTDIVRKKTKLPTHYDEEIIKSNGDGGSNGNGGGGSGSTDAGAGNDRNKNDPTILVNEHMPRLFLNLTENVSKI